MRRARQFTEEESVDFLFYNTEMDQGGRRRETHNTYKGFHITVFWL
jgi:hypothetical protein